MTKNCNQNEPQPIRFSALDGNQHIIIYDMGPKENYFRSKIQAFFNFKFFFGSKGKGRGRLELVMSTSRGTFYNQLCGYNHYKACQTFI